MSQFQSILEVLLVTNKSGVAKASQKPYSINEAHCVLRNDDGTPGAVGVLVIPKALEEKIKVGTTGMFTASFALQSGAFGDNQGRIGAVLTDVVPVPPATQARLRENVAKVNAAAAAAPAPTAAA